MTRFKSPASLLADLHSKLSQMFQGDTDERGTPTPTDEGGSEHATELVRVLNIDDVQKTLEDAERRAERAERLQRRAEKRLHMVEDDYAKTRHRVQRLKEEREALIGELSGSKQSLSEYEAAIARERARVGEREKEFQTASAENDRRFHALQKAFDEQQSLLAVRTTELVEAQAFLSTMDVISHAEIASMVEYLNAEILQIAAQIAYSSSFSNSELSDPRPLLDASTKLIGRSMTELLYNMRSDEDAACVQMALQAALASVVEQFVNSWAVGGTIPDDVDKILNGAFTSMLHDEPTSVCSKWRMLTSRYTAAEHATDLPDELRAKMLQALCDLLLLSGASTTPADVQAQFADSVQVIATKATSLCQAIKEGALSAHFRLYLPRFGDRFFETRMEDCEDDDAGRKAEGSQGSRREVLCATALGLERQEGRNSSEGRAERLHSAVVLKPRVILTSFAEDVYHELKEKDSLGEKYPCGRAI